MKRKVLWILLAVVLLVALGGFAYSRRGPEPTEVQMAKVGREDLQAKVSANGKIQAQKKVDISATIPGQITHLAVEEGDRVKKGQFLLQIDAVNPRAAARSNEFSMQALRGELDSARAALEQARADLRRAERNFRRGIIPAAEMRARAHGGDDRRGGVPGGRAPRRAGRRHARRGARHAGQDDDPLADGRHRHRPPGRGGRGGGDRRPEQPGHGAADDLGHVGRRGGAGGRRDLDPQRQARPGGAGPRSTPTPTRPSAAWSPRWAAARSPPPPTRRSSSRSRSA